jgi:DNA repair protein RadC
MRELEIIRPSVAAPLCFTEPDLADHELLEFALTFAGAHTTTPLVDNLLGEFGDVEIILASSPADLRARGGLDSRAVAILKLLHAFRADNRRGQLLN